MSTSGDLHNVPVGTDDIDDQPLSADHYRDPSGPDPEGIPDPMPESLRDTSEADTAFDEMEPGEGDAPSG